MVIILISILVLIVILGIVIFTWYSSNLKAVSKQSKIIKIEIKEDKTVNIFFNFNLNEAINE